MKNGYVCKCGWRLERGKLTRREYADEKRIHSYKCEALSKELAQSRKAVSA